MTGARQSDIPPPVIATRAGKRPMLFWIVVALVGAGLVTLYFFNPAQHSFYPACQFFKLTQLHCPGCGALRAFHLLTHGEIHSAFSSNPLLVGGIPIVAGIGFWRWKTTPQRAHTVWIRPVESWVILAIVILFGIVRNLPMPSVAWMSP